jgi:DNA invertase Pin-like site-specific DNA recombinase
MEVVYLRVSTDDQNPENQKKEVLSLFEGSDVEIYEENKSAFKDDFKREEFNKILKLIRQNKVSKIAVWDLDRIYRNRGKLKEFFELCSSRGVEVLSFRQKWLNDIKTNNESLNQMLLDMLLNILGWLAEEESQKKSDRVKIAYKNHKGKTWGRPESTLDYSTLLKIHQLKQNGLSIRKIMVELDLKKNQVEKGLKVSVKSPLEKCNSFINEMAQKGRPLKEQLKDK